MISASQAKMIAILNDNDLLWNGSRIFVDSIKGLKRNSLNALIRRNILRQQWDYFGGTYYTVTNEDLAKDEFHNYADSVACEFPWEKL